MRIQRIARLVSAGILAAAFVAAVGACNLGGEAEPTDTPSATATLPPQESPTPDETLEPTGTPDATGTPVVTGTPDATGTPEVTETPEATGTPVVTETPEATGTPEVTETPEATGTPVVTETPEATGTPEVTETPEAQVTAEGTISSVDAETRELTATLESGEELTVTVSQDALIASMGSPSTLEELPVGAKAVITYDQNTLEASMVLAEQGGTVAEGEITEVNVQQEMIGFTADDGTFVILRVTEATRITVNGEPALMTDLEEGSAASVTYDPDTDIASSIRVGEA